MALGAASAVTQREKASFLVHRSSNLKTQLKICEGGKWISRQFHGKNRGLADRKDGELMNA